MPSSDTTSTNVPPDGIRVAVLGMNHVSAPIDVREEIAFSDVEVPDVLERLANANSAVESVLLSTCNRTEVYIAGPHPESAMDAAAGLLDGQRGTTVLGNPEWTYRHIDGDAVRHLYTVAAGLDSLMVGEASISGDVFST